jgi:hypothetical protein
VKGREAYVVAMQPKTVVEDGYRHALTVMRRWKQTPVHSATFVGCADMPARSSILNSKRTGRVSVAALLPKLCPICTRRPAESGEIIRLDRERPRLHRKLLRSTRIGHKCSKGARYSPIFINGSAPHGLNRCCSSIRTTDCRD